MKSSSLFVSVLLGVGALLLARWMHNRNVYMTRLDALRELLNVDAPKRAATRYAPNVMHAEERFDQERRRA